MGFWHLAAFSLLVLVGGLLLLVYSWGELRSADLRYLLFPILGMIAGGCVAIGGAAWLVYDLWRF